MGEDEPKVGECEQKVGEGEQKWEREGTKSDGNSFYNPI